MANREADSLDEFQLDYETMEEKRTTLLDDENFQAGVQLLVEGEIETMPEGWHPPEDERDNGNWAELLPQFDPSSGAGSLALTGRFRGDHEIHFIQAA